MSELGNSRAEPKKRWRVAGIAAALLGAAVLSQPMLLRQRTEAEAAGVSTAAADFMAAGSTAPGLADFTAGDFTLGRFTADSTATSPACTMVSAMAAAGIGTTPGIMDATAGGVTGWDGVTTRMTTAGPAIPTTITPATTITVSLPLVRPGIIALIRRGITPM